MKKIDKLNDKIATIECNISDLQFETKKTVDNVDDIIYRINSIESQNN